MQNKYAGNYVNMQDMQTNMQIMSFQEIRREYDAIMAYLSRNMQNMQFVIKYANYANM